MDDCDLKLLTEAAADTNHLTETANYYSKLRRLLNDPSSDTENEFRKLFSKYYGLNAAGLTNEWKDAYFNLLFCFRDKMPDNPHRVALQKLYPLPRIKKDRALQFSFVSKLVAIHDEQQPIFDRYVQSYFGLGPPSLAELTEFRISGFVQNLNEIGRRYRAWSEYKPFVAILGELQQKVPGLTDCHSFRICDFLVWSVGRKYQRANRVKTAKEA